ncbi:COG0583: Transcriptional regulator [Klebsiella aerogenes]|nr:COG0583: Transcriptional regulator [Klebsiella aerogenes]
MKRGSVSVGMVQALAEGGFAAALAEIIASWPWLELNLQVADSHTVSQKVRQADLDVGLILDPQGQAGLSVLAFAELEVGIVMRPDHPLAGAKALSLGELSLERHIVPGAPLIVHERVALLYRHHDFAPENTISCNDIRLIKSLVLRGSGVTLLSLLDVLDEVSVDSWPLSAAQYAAATADPGAVYCTLASAFAARANGHSDAECGDRIHGDGQPSGR